MSILVRNLYRTLLRRAKLYDDQPVLKALLTRAPLLEDRFIEPIEIEPMDRVLDRHITHFLGSDVFYRPALPKPHSMVATVRAAFRTPAENSDASIDAAFKAFRYLEPPLSQAECFPHPHDNTHEDPNAPSPSEGNAGKVEPLVAPVLGSVLISHPLMNDPNFQRKVVLLCNYSKKTGFKGLILNSPLTPQRTETPSTGNETTSSEEAAVDPPKTKPAKERELEDWLVKQQLFKGGPVSRNLFQLLHSRPELGGKRLLPLPSQIPGFWENDEESDEGEIMGAGPPSGGSSITATSTPEAKAGAKSDSELTGDRIDNLHGDNLYFGLDPAQMNWVVQDDGISEDVRVFAGEATWVPGQLEGELESGCWLVAQGSGKLLLGKPLDDGSIPQQPRHDLWEELLLRLGGEYAGFVDLDPTDRRSTSAEHL